MNLTAINEIMKQDFGCQDKHIRFNVFDCDDDRGCSPEAGSYLIHAGRFKRNPNFNDKDYANFFGSLFFQTNSIKKDGKSIVAQNIRISGSSTGDELTYLIMGNPYEFIFEGSALKGRVDILSTTNALTELNYGFSVFDTDDNNGESTTGGKYLVYKGRFTPGLQFKDVDYAKYFKEQFDKHSSYTRDDKTYYAKSIHITGPLTNMNAISYVIRGNPEEACNMNISRINALTEQNFEFSVFENEDRNSEAGKYIVHTGAIEPDPAFKDEDYANLFDSLLKQYPSCTREDNIICAKSISILGSRNPNRFLYTIRGNPANPLKQVNNNDNMNIDNNNDDDG